MAPIKKHKWTFSSRFRRNAFGWRSQTPIKRIKEAVSEIKSVSRKEPLLAGEGAVLLITKLSPALEHVDSSSGAIGTAVNNAINALVPIITKASADNATRKKWLDRLWKAVEEDNMPYIEMLIEHWGILCQTAELASTWADILISPVKITWSEEYRGGGGYFKGTPACLSSLLTAGRNQEIMDLLTLAPYKSWHERKWGVKALVAMGKRAEALRYAEDSRDNYSSPVEIAQICEEILLSSGLGDDAYSRYAIDANRKTTYLATFRAIAKKYPDKEAKVILADLVADSPGQEGKWFAAAKSVGLYKEAIVLANSTPCDPRTLTRAARDMKTKEPGFAVEAGIAALHWLTAGYGYEITGMDVWDAYKFTIEAAVNADCQEQAKERVKRLISTNTPGSHFASEILKNKLG
ncbi:hypothetical protein MNBD_DELTA03-138 [hydrothermal vent metagenome]|uniref:Uncharacterized protein n=1 Tax=hydrothermal vent metagenome TaxID=652676 RepID=A0A3B0VCK1_9ZZZZ